MEQPAFLFAARGIHRRDRRGQRAELRRRSGSILANDFQLLGTEAAPVYGPLSLQAEWMASNVDSTAAGNLYFNTAYLMASYFLTGEHRGYNRKVAWFDHQKVFEPFFCVCTPDGICKGSRRLGGCGSLVVHRLGRRTGARRLSGRSHVRRQLVVEPQYAGDVRRHQRRFEEPRSAGESEADIFLTRFQVNW